MAVVIKSDWRWLHTDWRLFMGPLLRDYLKTLCPSLAPPGSRDPSTFAKATADRLSTIFALSPLIISKIVFAVHTHHAVPSADKSF